MMDNIVDDLIEDATYRRLSIATTLTENARAIAIARFSKIVVHFLFSTLGQACRTCQLFVGKGRYSVVVRLK